MLMMEEGLGSDGDLIVKKKKDENSSSVNVSGNDKKKGARLARSDSESSGDSLERFNKKVVETSSLRNGEDESDKKRRLDVFEFDEYDKIDEKRFKKDRDTEPLIEKSKQFNRMSKEEVAGNSVKSRLKIKENDGIDEKRMKKERGVGPGSSKYSLGRKKELVDYSVKSRLKVEDDDDGDLPISSLIQKARSPPNEPIKVRGKNGVSKVTVSEEKKMEVRKKSNYHKLDIEDKMSKSVEIIKKNKSVVEARSPSRGVKRQKVQTPKKITPVRASVSKINRGSGTEKQKLREKLKNVLLDAGWKIDYRPRRSRDYLDAVYISPTGTAYWSIVKAYDAFQKHMDSDDEMEPYSFSEDIKMLTRKTQKKIEKEMKMEQKENNRKRRFAQESDEDSDSDEDEDEDEEDKPSVLVEENDESMKGNNSLKKKAGKLLKETDDRKSCKFGRRTLLVRSSEKGLNSENEGYIAYTGKRTLISWLIDSGIVSSGEKVKYMNKRQTRVLLEGWATRGGIHCSCCSKVVSVSKFEIHAGSKLRQPYQNIYLESGVSLLQCQIEAWNKQEGSDHTGFHCVDIDGDDPNDDTCCLCGDGGDLICCDSCPSTFHQSCLDIEMLPLGDWHCPNCTCKFCGIGGAGSSADEDDTAVNVMLICGLCEKKYHKSCCRKIDDSSDSSRSSASFCGAKCQEIFDHLQKILGVKNELDAGFSWSLIHRCDMDADASHRSFQQRVESNSKLAVALSVMDECFLPIVDRRSGIDLVNSVVYNCGSNFSRLNYSSFYTVILERGDEIVAAASIRVRGTQLAEMPFVGTRHMYRRQGMCRRLLGAIESLLCSLEVKKLTIPAIVEHMHMWTAIFGFKSYDVADKGELRSINMVVFPGIDMLQKFLVKDKTSEVDITANSENCSKQMINEGVDPVSPLSSPRSSELGVEPTSTPNQLGRVSPSFPNCSKGLDEGSKTDLSQIDVVSPSSPPCIDRPDVHPATDSCQLDSDQLNKTDSKLDEAVKGCDSVVVPDSEADPADNSNDLVSKTVSDKPVFCPNPENNGEAIDNLHHVDLPTQNGTLEDGQCVLEVESGLHVDSTVSSGDVLQLVKVNSYPLADGDVDNGHKDNGEVASLEPGLDCFTETPLQNNSINEDRDPLSVSRIVEEETISKLRFDSENDMAKDGLEVIAPIEPNLNSTSAEDTVKEVKENTTI